MNEFESFDQVGPGFREVFTAVLNALAAAMEDGTLRVYVTYTLDHETMTLGCTIHETRFPDSEFVQ